MVHKWLFALLMSCLSKKLERLSAPAPHPYSTESEKPRHPLGDQGLYLKVKHFSHLSVEEQRVFAGCRI